MLHILICASVFIFIAQLQEAMMELEAKKARGEEKQKAATARKPGNCRTCGGPMLGHSKQKCVKK